MRKSKLRKLYCLRGHDILTSGRTGRGNCRECNRVYKLTHKKKVEESNKIYFEKNKRKIRNYNKNYNKQKYQKDIHYKLAVVLRHRLNLAIKNNQKLGSAVKDLGCTIPELKIHLEKQFKDGMSWSNYGNGRGNWNIDHIKALANFDLIDKEQFLKAVNYKNLQPLWVEENIKKSNKE